MLTVLAVVLAVLGASCYAVAARLQHEAVRQPPSRGALVRRPRWLAGLLLLGLGGALHVSALRLAPVTVVQPLGVTGVVVSVVRGLRVRRRRPDRGTLLALVAVVAGTAAFAVLAARVTVPTPVTVPAQLWAGLLVLSAVGASAVSARLFTGRGRCVAWAFGAGCAYGCVSVLARAAGEEVTAYGVSGVLYGTLAGLALAGAAGFWLAQRAHAAGPPEVTVACLTVVDPLVAVSIGFGLLGEAPGLPAGTAVAGLACWLVSLAGVLHISRSTPFSQVSPSRPTDGRPSSPSSSRQEHFMPSTTPRPQRIVIGADTFPPDVNGAANFAYRLAEGLVGQGHQVHVICPAAETGPGTLAVNGIAVHRLASHRTPVHPTFRLCLPWEVARPAARLLDEIAPDVVHIQSHFAVCRTLAAAAHRRRVPVVATNHFMPENLIGYTHLPAPLGAAACRLAWRDVVRVFRRARFVTAPTPRAVQLLYDNGLTQPALPVSCGLDLARFSQPATDRADGETRVLFVGRLDEEKNVHVLLRALALLPERPEVRAEIVGDGSCRRDLDQLAHELGIQDRVTFHGPVSDQEVLDAYVRCDVFCMPGTAELQSLATMEAMAAGLPVVAADAMALPHLVHPGRNGYLFPPGDIRALAGFLTTLAEHPELRRGLGEAGREVVAGHDIGRTLDAFEDLYLRAAGRRPTATVSLPHPRLVHESERHEYAARSGRR